MIRTTERFARALAIKELLLSNEELQSASIGADVYVEAYQNGREQGVTLWGLSSQQAYFISEHRNSDSIVIYKGNYSMQSLSDDAYAHKNFFPTIEQAVEWLRDELMVYFEKENNGK